MAKYTLDDLSQLYYVHPLEWSGEELPAQFTFPFRYTPHPLCVRAARIVQERLTEMAVEEGKMFGVLVVRNGQLGMNNKQLFFLAAYSGQLCQSYDHPWFVPPVVDYLNPESFFQKEQAAIVAMGIEIEALRNSRELKRRKDTLATLKKERDVAVAEAKRAYSESKRDNPTTDREGKDSKPDIGAYIRLRQFQKAEIHRAKQLHKYEIAETEKQLASHAAAIHALSVERKRRSEALQQWLFEQFKMLNAKGEYKNLIEIFAPSTTLNGGTKLHLPPSGAGECCAPKLLQAAYWLGLSPVAMAEFWWGPSKPSYYKEPGAFFPACHRKCRPILSHMLQGLNVSPDPAEHYERVLKPVGVVWEDEFLAVISKPEGWCSIPGKSDQANLYDESLRLWPDITGSIIVHRLDQDTSGVMVIAKSALVHRALSQQFERRVVRKKYIALIEGSLLPVSSWSDGETEGGKEKGLIDLPLGPDLENMPHRCVDHEHGKEAVTKYEVLNTEMHNGQRVTRVAFYPGTGRTHQLRVHASASEGLNAPIVGDRLYGHVADRLYLHAESIQFMHPITGKEMHFEVPCPF